MTSPEPDELLAIAHVVRPHGVRGEISVIALAPPVLDIVELLIGRLYARSPQGATHEVAVEGLRPHQDRLLLKLVGIDTMDDAQTMRDFDLCLPRAELPALPEGWFWEADLQRCHVFDRTLGEIGTVAGLDVSGAQPLLQLRRPDGAQALIPWVRALIIEVNLETGQIQTDLPADFPGISASNTRA